MSDRVFFDSTILLYTVSKGDPREVAAQVLLGAGGCLNVQVLNEFSAVARRKLKMSWPEVKASLRAIRDLCEPPTPLTVATHEHALQIAERYGYHIYDALILAAALAADCNVLYSEDMQHGQKIGSLLIQNPFVVRTQ